MKVVKPVFWMMLLILLVIVGFVLFNKFIFQPIRPAVFTSNVQRDDFLQEVEHAATQENNKEVGGFKTFGRFKVHSDFSLQVFSRDVKNPRVMIFDSVGNLLVSETKVGKVSVIKDDQKVELVTGLSQPHGLAFEQGQLYVAQTGQVVRYDYDQIKLEVTNPQVILDLPAGGRHWTRTIGFGADEKLYISVGSSCNICIEEDWRRTKILQYDLQTQELKVYASGLRNAVFFQWNSLGDLYATEMGRDWLGDELPPDEFLLIKEGKDYGFPYCYGKNIVDPEYDQPEKCEKAEPSLYNFKAHESPLGVAFLGNDAYISLHGSWNRSEPIGYEVIRLLGDTNYQERQTIMAGWLQEDGSSIGRPAGLASTPDGSLFIADDKGDVIYKLVPNF